MSCYISLLRKNIEGIDLHRWEERSKNLYVIIIENMMIVDTLKTYETQLTKKRCNTEYKKKKKHTDY